MKKLLGVLMMSSLLFSLQAEYRTIIFDLGGVIFADNFHTFMEEEFKEEDEIPFYLLEACKDPLWQEWNKGLVTLQALIDHLSVTYERQHIIRLFNIFLNPKRPLIEETVQIIMQLKRQGYEVYILSNLARETHEVFVNGHAEFFQQFNGMYFSFQTGMVKPDECIYDHFLTTFKLDPAESLFIDDREQNIVAGKQKGINGIVYKQGTLAEELLKFDIVVH